MTTPPIVTDTDVKKMHDELDALSHEMAQDAKAFTEKKDLMVKNLNTRLTEIATDIEVAETKTAADETETFKKLADVDQALVDGINKNSNE